MAGNLTAPMTAPVAAGIFDPRTITRPDPTLLTYYMITAALTLFGFPFVALAMYFRYITLRYRFDDEGVSMAWGILFRKEVYLTYRRIQDIHVTRNIIQRWMGLATVAIQTASGSSTPEMSIEGVLEADALRNFLYQKMRGAKGLDHPNEARSAAAVASAAPGELSAAMAGYADPSAEALELLREIRDSMANVSKARVGGEREGRP